MKNDTVKIINPDLVPGFIVYKENLIAWNKDEPYSYN